MLGMWAHLCHGVTVKDSRAHRVVVLWIMWQERFSPRFGVPYNMGRLIYTGWIQYSSTDKVARCNAEISRCVPTCGCGPTHSRRNNLE